MERARAQAPEVEPQPKAERLAAKLNKNFLNFPLARDPRTETNFRRDPDTELMWINLPGERNIGIAIPIGQSPEFYRAPNALDINVLAQIMSEAQNVKGRGPLVRWIEFASKRELVRRLGLTVQHNNWMRVEESLGYLLMVRIEFDRWYQHRRPRKPAHRVKLTLPPPITNFRWDGNRMGFDLNPEWAEMARAGYYAAMPLPLPSNAAAQNLVLLVMTSRTASSWPSPSGKDTNAGYPRDLRKVTRRIGLNHRRRNEVFKAATEEAVAWFEEHGGSLEVHELPGDKIQIYWTMPTIPRPRYARYAKSRKPVTHVGGPNAKEVSHVGAYKRKKAKAVRPEGEDAAGAAGSRFARSGKQTRGFYPEPDEFLRIERDPIHEDPYADAQDREE
jgi:hypothetical protein